MKNLYLIQVLNAQRKLIAEQSVRGLREARQAAREIPEAFMFGLSHPGTPSYAEYKRDGEWRGITHAHFQRMLRKHNPEWASMVNCKLCQREVRRDLAFEDISPDGEDIEYICEECSPNP